MYRIEHDVFSHIHSTKLEYPKRGFGDPRSKRYQGSEWCSVAKVRQSYGCDVGSFRDLVGLVAEIGFRNRAFNLLFRGQGTDYKDSNDRTKSCQRFFVQSWVSVPCIGPHLRLASLS